MRYANIEFEVSNGLGCGYSLYVQGCRHRCKNCFNPETWGFDGGSEFTKNTVERVLTLLDKDYIKRLTIIGGEPFEPENQGGITAVLREVKKRFPDKKIWCYTGFTIEELKDVKERCRTEYTDEMLSMIDVLVDGRYVDELRDLTIAFRGSSNQRIIVLKEDDELYGYDFDSV